MSLSVYACVCKHISETARIIFTKFFVLVTYGRGSVLLWWCCDTLCTSGLCHSSLPFCSWGLSAGYQPRPQVVDRGTTARYGGQLRYI